MDCISQLPDAMLLRILSLLPAKDVVATMVLSKRWQFLWLLVPKLVYDSSQFGHGISFSRFVDRSLVLHEAPVIQSLNFKLGQECGAGDIRVWIKAVENRCVRELIIKFDTSITLPRSLYTSCRMLVTLTLRNAVLLDHDDVTSPISFPSLKKLILESMKYPGDEFVTRLLAGCPVLEDLGVNQCLDDNVTIFTVKVPSLKRLTYYKSGSKGNGGEDGLVIDAPSLEYMFFCFKTNMFCIVENEIPGIEEANVVTSLSISVEILSSITSLKRLFVCLPSSKDAYYVGSVFHCLVNLKMCTCEPEWLNLLMRLLEDSPKLQSIRLEQSHLRGKEPRPIWIEPSSVPECLLSSLETLHWVHYEDKEEDKQVAAFILRSARCLKKMTICSQSTDLAKKLELLKELSMSFRASPTCQLAFD